jgi:hypothetical protein
MQHYDARQLIEKVMSEAPLNAWRLRLHSKQAGEQKQHAPFPLIGNSTWESK